MIKLILVLLPLVGCKAAPERVVPQGRRVSEPAALPALVPQAMALPVAKPSRTKPLTAASSRPARWYPWLCRGSRCAAGARRASMVDRFPLPPGCRRVPYRRGSFADWVRHLPLRPVGSRAVDYRGQAIETRMPALAVVDIDVYPRGRDWQQCADYGLRLGVEYLARFRSGRPVRWWLQNGKGYRFSPTAANRLRHLRKLFVFLGTFGLKSYFPSISAPAQLRPGDIVVGNSTGAIGHAVVVNDVISCAGGQRRFLISQSWIPAQSPHVPRLGERSSSPYVTWSQLASFIREVTGDNKAHLRRLPGI